MSNPIADWCNRKREQDKLADHSDAIVNNAVKEGRISTAEFEKYKGLSLNQRAAFAAGLAAQLATELHLKCAEYLAKQL